MLNIQKTSTGTRETQTPSRTKFNKNSARMDSEKTSIKRSARIPSKGQKTAEENENDSEDLDQPNVKRMKPSSPSSSVSTNAPASAIRTPKLFCQETLNVALQLSAGCRIGPNFDETKIRRLPPYESLPYPDLYTRVVQDLIRCSFRPEEVVAALKVSAPGEPFTIVTYFDKVNGKLECRNIPVVDDVNSAQSWLSEWLESLGCCKKLFLPDFLAEEFVCKQCFELNQGQRRGVAASGEEAASDHHANVVKPDPDDDVPSLPPLNEVGAMEADGPCDEPSDEDSEGTEAPETPESAIAPFSPSVADPTAIDHLKLEENEASDTEPEEEMTEEKECYNNLNAFFISLFKPLSRLRSDIGNVDVSNFVSDLRHVRSSVSVDCLKEMWKLGDEEAMDARLFKKITKHNCSEVRVPLHVGGTMLEMWHNLLLHCHRCITSSSFSEAVAKVNRFVADEEEKWREADADLSFHSESDYVPPAEIPVLLEEVKEEPLDEPSTGDSLGVEADAAATSDVEIKEEMGEEDEEGNSEAEEKAESSLRSELHQVSAPDEVLVVLKEEHENLRDALAAVNSIDVEADAPFTSDVEIKQETVREERRKIEEEERRKAEERRQRALERQRKEMMRQEKWKQEEERKRKEEEQREKEWIAKKIRKQKDYGNLNAFFIHFFKSKEMLCLDSKVTEASDFVSDLGCDHVRSRIYMDETKEIWKLGDEEAMDSHILKKITPHRCFEHFSPLNTFGTMLDLWRSLLLRCPGCVPSSSLSEAIEKVKLFVADEEKKWVDEEEKESARRMKERLEAEEEERKRIEEEKRRVAEEEKQKKIEEQRLKERLIEEEKKKRREEEERRKVEEEQRKAEEKKQRAIEEQKKAEEARKLREAEQRKEEEKRKAEEERIRRDQEQRLNKQKETEEKKKQEAEKERKDRAENERMEKEAQERLLWKEEEKKQEMVIANLLKEGRTRTALSKELYNNMNAFFFYHFKLPEGRTELRPDLGNPVVKNCPDLSLMHMVSSNSFRHNGKELWQLGDQMPMDSSILKAITTHSCSTRNSSLNTEGTLLELWHSLLLHCPECINERSLKGALNMVREFIETECKEELICE